MGILLLLFLYCAYQSIGWEQGLDGRCLPPPTSTPRVEIFACIVPHILQRSIITIYIYIYNVVVIYWAIEPHAVRRRANTEVHL